MNVYFKTIYFENFLSFKDGFVDLSDNGFTLVSGKNTNSNDMAKSNGSGKSAIWEAISWVLTGETIRGVKDVSNIYTDSGALVTLNFTVDNHEYEIKRSKDHCEYKTNLKIFIDGEDKSGKGIRDSEKLLKEYLPDMTASLIGSVILLGQGMPSRFSNNTPSGRKEVLERLSKSDFMIEELKNKVNSRELYLNNQLKEIEVNFRNIEYKISDTEVQIDKYKKMLIELESIECSNVDSLKTQVKDINKTITNLELDISKLSEAKVKLNETYNADCSNLNQQYKVKIINVEEELAPLLSRKQYLKFNIDSLSKIINDIKNRLTICPTCGKPFDNIENIDTTDKEAELEILKAEYSTISKKLSDTESCLQTLKFELSNKESELLATYNSKKHDIDFEYLKTDETIRQHRTTLQKLETEITKITLAQSVYNSKVQEYTDQINLYEKQIVDLSDKKMYNNIEREKVNSRLAINSKMKSALKRDFRGILLKNVIDYISIRAKDYCKEVFETDKINFELDGNNINISYCGKQYENLSGGEKQKIDIIVQFSIRDMLCRFLNFSSNIIVLDEIFDNLDDIGTQKVLNLITKNLTDVSSIYIVTHHTDISIPFDRELVVIKNNDGISSIQ